MKVHGWLVTDERGDEALLREEIRALNYATRVRGGTVDALVKRSDAMAEIEEAGRRRADDNE